MTRRLRWLAAASTLLLGVGVAYGQSPDKQRLRQLLDQVARGSEVEAADAADQLLEAIMGPVAEVFASFDSRPVAEQMRLQKVMSRLSAALRARAFRASLPPKDRKLLDRFNEVYPQLVEQLFEDDPYRRLAALRQIPLERGTAAGLLIAAKLNHENDTDVIEATFELAAELKDDVVARGLARFVREATELVESGYYGPGEQAYPIVLGGYITRAIKVLADADARDALPDVLHTLKFYGHTRFSGPYMFDVAVVADALAKLGDERSAAVLLDYLEDPDVRRIVRIGPGKAVRRTLGDIVLLSLLRLYKLEAKDFGVYIDPESQTPVGFLEEAQRVAARKRFLIWHAANADKPPAQRKPPASQPAEKK